MCDRGPTCNSEYQDGNGYVYGPGWHERRLEKLTKQRKQYYQEISAIANFWWEEAQTDNAYLFQTPTGQKGTWHYWAYVKDDHPGGPGKEVR